MSASAFGQVVYGLKVENSLLRVARGTLKVCSYQKYHVLGEGGFCPKCGSRVNVIDNLVPSQNAIDYAKRIGMDVNNLIKTLDKYEQEIPVYFDETPQLIFGLQIAWGGTNSCSQFSPANGGIEEMNKIFLEFGLDPKKAEYLLLVSLS